MNSYIDVFQILQESFDSLQRSGLIQEPIVVNKDTILLGKGSILDSIAFVTLITDLEDRLNRTVGNEISLVLNEITDFDINKPYLNANTIANYILKLINS